MHSLLRTSLLAVALIFCLNITAAQADKTSRPSQHYLNPKVNPDPDYVPGAYPEPDTKASIAHYQDMVDLLDPDGDIILDVSQEEGEISWKAIKNKTASVLGYFRTYDGYVSFNNGKFSKAELLISVNSVDSAVPGRDNRIKTIFFKSMESQMSTGVLVLDKIVKGSPYISAIQNGAPHQLIVEGLFTLGAITVPVKTTLEVTWDSQEEVLSVKTVKSLPLLISDLKLGSRVAPLMVECNHKSMGNLVEINCKLKFE